MKVLSIVVTYNGRKWYSRCFNSLYNSNMKTDVFVVDNSSTDDTVSYIEREFPQVILYTSPTNLGFGQANNIGINYAFKNKYDYVFLLNQDAWLNSEDALRNLVLSAADNKEYGIFSPIQLYGDGSRITTGCKQHMLDIAIKGNDFISDVYHKNLKKIYEVEISNAASWLLPIDVLRKVGGFDPIFFMYGEDDNLLYRIQYFGYKIGIVPLCEVCHDVEFRGDDYNIEYNNYTKNLLVYYTNININFNFLQEYTISLFRLVKSLFYFKLSKKKRLCSSFVLLTRRMRAIIFSRKMNRIGIKTWLKDYDKK